MDVTVVIPVWDDYVAFLPDALASARRCGADVLVVDNASHRRLPPLDVPVVRTPRRLTIGAARDFGLGQAATRWVVVLDADDMLVPGAVARLLAAADAAGLAPVAVAPAIVDARSGQRSHWPRPWTRRLTRLRRIFALLNATWSLYPTIGALLDREAAIAVGGFGPNEIGDDWELGAMLALHGRVAVTAVPGRAYRRHEASVSAGWTARHVLRSAAQVRRRLRASPGTPPWARAAGPLLAVAQLTIALLARPVARAGRRRLSATRRSPAAQTGSAQAAVLPIR
jgi:hypothetical protein